MGLADDEDENGAEEVTLPNGKEIDFFPSTINSLTDAELKSPAVLKMVIQENKRNNKELIVLRKIEAEYHKCDKELAVALEKNKKKLATEILSDFVYAVGGILLATSTTDFSKGFELHNGIFIVVGLLLLIGSVISKYFFGK